MSTHRYPVPRLASQIEQEWSAALAKRFNCALEAFLGNPIKFMDYKSETVRVELMDGSSVEFKYAFAIVSQELKAIAVFTEHCGNHVFPYHEAKVYQDGRLQFQQTA
jgi:hypothetical protein